MSKIDAAKSVLQDALRRTRVNGKVAARTFKKFPAQNKVGLGLGVTSLGVSLASYKRNSAVMDLNEQRTELDQQSLSALQKIHKALTAKPKPIV